MNIRRLLTMLNVFFLLPFLSCKNSPRNSIHTDVPELNIIKGKQLAATYCQSCHMLPDPSWVDTKTWENDILPHMAPMLGIFYFQNKTYPSYKHDFDLRPDFYPSKQILTDEEWQHIIEYYASVSPDSMISSRGKVAINMQLKQFTVIQPAYQYSTPSVCMVKIDTSNPALPFIVSDALRQEIFLYNKNLQLKDSLKVKGEIVSIEKEDNKWTACDIGVLNPNNGRYGKVYRVVFDPVALKDSSAMFNGLRRPVEIKNADFNNDGKTDYAICEFGFLEGALSWMENKGHGKYERHVIRPLPGAIKIYIQDYNHDGRPDIWALFSQGEEGIFLFVNKGDGEFTQEQVLRFPPINGSSSFELDDFNNDGHPDILYTCGDNADYSPVLKPFHGVYIFLNDGNNHFTRQYFFAINGCYKAIAKDFDKDGDLDIATIAYFADYERRPEEGFVYLQNMGNNNFLPYSIAQAQYGRWLTMDAGDYDGDGYSDLILGNFSMAPSFVKSKIDWKNSPSFMILKNNGKNK